MKLREKTLLYMGGVLLLLFAATIATFYRVLQADYARLENDLAVRNLMRAREALMDEIRALGEQAADWSLWDDTYEFVQRPNQTYIDGNLNKPSIETIRLNLIAYLRPGGEMVYGQGFDLEETSFRPLPEGLADFLKPGSLLLRHKDAEDRRMGLIMLKDGPMLVAASPIMTSRREGPMQGTLIFGRWLHPTVLSKLEGLTLRPVEIIRLDVSPRPAETGRVVKEIERTGLYALLPGAEGLLLGFIGMPDIHGREALLIRVSLPRDITAAGRRSFFNLMSWLTLSGVLFGSVSLFVLNRHVLSRLTRLMARAKGIQSREDLSIRLPVEGRDEIAALAEGLNTMLNDLEESVRQRETAEVARRESEALYKLLFSEMHSGFALHEIVCDPDGRPHDYRFLEINHAFEELTGLKRERIIGRTVREVLPDTEPTWIERYGRVALTGEAEHFERYSRELDRHFYVTAYSPRKGQFAVIFDDITQRRQAEEERTKLQRLESLGVLAGGIAHDFNNILTSVVGNIHLARTHSPDLSPEAQELLAESEKAAAQAKALTSQLLTFAQGGSPIKTVCNLNELLRETTVFALRGSSSRSEFDIPEDLWRVEADAGQIGQVIQNIVLNAAQSMPSGGTVSVSARRLTPEQAKAEGLRPAKYIQFSIADRGLGIPEKDQDRVFDPYFTTKPNGSGLGLAASLSIVRKHSGRITLAPRDGGGTVFHVYLPATDKPLPSETAAGMALRPPDGKRVLVVDDDEGVRKLMRRMLQRAGFDVLCAEDGNEAVRRHREALAAGRPFDVVILDLTMPGGMGGQDTLAEMKRTEPGVKAIVASGYAHDPVLAHFREAGFADLVTKPFKHTELIAAIQRVMDG